MQLKAPSFTPSPRGGAALISYLVCVTGLNVTERLSHKAHIERHNNLKTVRYLNSYRCFVWLYFLSWPFFNVADAESLRWIRISAGLGLMIL